MRVTDCSTPSCCAPRFTAQARKSSTCAWRHRQSFVASSPVRPEACVAANGLARTPTEPGVDLPDFAEEQRTHSVRQAS